MNNKSIIYEEKMKDRDNEFLNEFLYDKCVKQYRSIMNYQSKMREYKRRIKELEEENKKLRKLCDSRYKYGSNMESKYVVEHEKIRQAIEYIEKNSSAFNGEEEHLDKVYTILKGEENESN